MRLSELAQRVGGSVEGDTDRELTGVATLARAGAAQLSFSSTAATAGNWQTPTPAQWCWRRPTGSCSPAHG